MEFLGDDIKLNDDGDLQINIGGGDFNAASGFDCLIQDVLEEFKFPYFDDPDHPERGNLFTKFINSDPEDKLTVIEMKQEAKKILYRDPRIKKKSAIVEATPGKEGYLKISFMTISGNIVENLVVPISEEVTL